MSNRRMQRVLEPGEGEDEARIDGQGNEAMSHYYTSHVGILKYLSREFRAAAQAESNGDRFDVYAQLLERMADDLLVAVNTTVKS